MISRQPLDGAYPPPLTPAAPTTTGLWWTRPGDPASLAHAAQRFAQRLRTDPAFGTQINDAAHHSFHRLLSPNVIDTALGELLAGLPS